MDLVSNFIAIFYCRKQGKELVENSAADRLPSVFLKKWLAPKKSTALENSVASSFVHLPARVVVCSLTMLD